MKPTQAQPGHYWKTNDDADLPFDWAGTTPPTHVTCERVGHSTQGNMHPAEIPVECLNLIGVGTFGEGRGDRIKWTGDAYKFGIYRVDAKDTRGGAYYHHDDIVVVETNGAGMFCYVFSTSCEGADLWAWIVTLPTTRIWDLCRTMIGTYKTGAGTERKRIFQAAIENRLKVNRRRRNYAPTVEIIPEPKPVGAAS